MSAETIEEFKEVFERVSTKTRISFWGPVGDRGVGERESTRQGSRFGDRLGNCWGPRREGGFTRGSGGLYVSMSLETWVALRGRAAIQH